MSSFILLILLFGFALVLFPMRTELRMLRRRVEELESLAFGPTRADDLSPGFPRAPARATVVVAKRGLEITPAIAGQSEPEPEPNHIKSRPSPFADLSFESLVGGKLPIWVGGIALVFAGFFLVRYTIEAGLFGPAARSVTATIFAFAMIAVSELGGRLPRIGASFTADPRVGQSLAGAGIATLYGTLYMAAEIYGLIGVPVAFGLVVIVTAIAFALSLRHGPPTALMGLIGGFSAPWVAGMGASNLPTLLLYLAVFIAALFGLALWRRWLWLLVLASGGGALWSLAMLATVKGNFPLLGGFIAISGASALLSARRFEGEQKGWSEAARLLPMALALVQLAILLPRMDFSLIAWLFYFALSALAIALAWRDQKLLPLVVGALLLSSVPLSAAWSENGANGLNVAMTFGIALLFGIAGQIRARYEDGPVAWALTGLAAPVLCWLAAVFADTSGISDIVWGAAAAFAAIASGIMAWDQHRRSVTAPLIQGAASAATALMALMACASWFQHEWAATYAATIALSVAAWARTTGVGHVRSIATVPLAAAILAGVTLSYPFLEALAASLSGSRVLYDLLPAVSDASRATLLPALLMLAITYQAGFATGRKTRTLAFFIGGAGVAAFLWLIAKQPAAIDGPGDFVRLGFAERAIFTQILFGLAFAALSFAKTRNWLSLANVGWVLTAVALFRIVWFDLLLLNPVMVAQGVGPVPVANLVTAHLALTAYWLWLMAKEAPPRFVPGLLGLSLGAMIVTVLATIRQAVQGNLIAGASVGTGENYLYSAGLLALAIGWLVIGMTRANKLLRVAGLSLLTAVTLKVFLIDAAALTGLLRILSFLGLGITLIGIGWAYGRLISLDKAAKDG